MGWGKSDSERELSIGNGLSAPIISATAKIAEQENKGDLIRIFQRRKPAKDYRLMTPDYFLTIDKTIHRAEFKTAATEVHRLCIFHCWCNWVQEKLAVLKKRASEGSASLFCLSFGYWWKYFPGEWWWSHLVRQGGRYWDRSTANSWRTYWWW